MRVYELDPLRDPRWNELVRKHVHGSVFHSSSWLQALRSTYGYEPVVVSTSAPNEPLANGMVFCRVESWLMGHRLISLPFSDHCQPLVETGGTLTLLLSYLTEQMNREKWKYIELRPMVSSDSDLAMRPCLSKWEEFHFHKLDLRPDLQTIFHNFHKSCVQRKIQRGERENLEYEAGRSERILDKFYGLLLLTRRVCRH